MQLAVLPFFTRGKFFTAAQDAAISIRPAKHILIIFIPTPFLFMKLSHRFLHYPQDITLGTGKDKLDFIFPGFGHGFTGKREKNA